MTEVSEIRQMVQLIARCLVDRPDEVSVEEIEQGDTLILRITVRSGEIGKLIGKQGRTARALRTILSAASMTSGRKISLDLVGAA